MGRAVRYVFYRMGWAKKPELYDIRFELMTVFGHVAGWDRRLNIVDGHLCPKSGPAVIAGNHFFMEDPFLAFGAVYYSSGTTMLLHPMMREGVFKQGSWGKSRLLDLDEVADMTGVRLISRDRVQLSQMKPFFQLLDAGETILIYPGRTRSRLGLFIDYPAGMDEPGAVSFFLSYAQRKHPETPTPTVPLVRTSNPVTKREAMVFGELRYLPANADREQQRAFDNELIVALGELVEINAAQLVSGLVYLRCLHGMEPEVAIATLVSQVQAALQSLPPHRKIDPALVKDAAGQVRRTVRWLEKQDMAKQHGERLALNREAILAAPAPDKLYRKRNPVKYLVNQILHLVDVTDALERATLDPANPGQTL